MSTEPITVYTIGHSNHDLPTFFELLRAHSIRTIADVRSRPYSRYAQHFTAHPLQLSAQTEGFDYVYLGGHIGGKPDARAYYDGRGYVDYGALAQARPFRDGIERLVALAGAQPTVIMCSEENPAECHRHLLIARVLRERFVKVLHIRGAGMVQTDEEIAASLANPQLDLFGDAESVVWRSSRPISLRE